MPDRLDTYAAALVIEWFGGRSGREYVLEERADAGVFIARGGGVSIAVAVGRLWEAESDPAAEAARASMEERLSAGLVRGPHLLWVPPRGVVPTEEPDASDFVQRVQQAAAPVQPGGRAEVELPVQVQMAKMRDEGGYASVIGGLSRWWTLITERVSGTFHVNASKMRRAPQSSQRREALFDQIGALSKGLETGQAVEFETVEAWTVERLRSEPLGQTGFAIAQAPPKIDPSEGSLVRRLVRKRLKDAAAALERIDADVKSVGLLAIFDYAENENIGSFVKSLDPSLYAKIGLVAALIDGEVRPIFQPRT